MSLYQVHQLQRKLRNRFLPMCVRYWDRQFANLGFIHQWDALKQIVNEQLPIIRHEFECSHRESLEIAWETYIDASNGEVDNPFQQVYIQLVQSLSEAELPLYLCHTSIGSDIHLGLSESDAIAQYQQWLQDDPEHPIFGQWALTQTLQVIPIEQFLAGDHP